MGVKLLKLQTLRDDSVSNFDALVQLLDLVLSEAQI